MQSCEVGLGEFLGMWGKELWGRYGVFRSLGISCNSDAVIMLGMSCSYSYMEVIATLQNKSGTNN